MVSDFPSVLFAFLVTSEEASHWHHCRCAVGFGTGEARAILLRVFCSQIIGLLATTRLSTRILGKLDICSWPLARVFELLHGELLDPLYRC